MSSRIGKRLSTSIEGGTPIGKPSEGLSRLVEAPTKGTRPRCGWRWETHFLGFHVGRPGLCSKKVRSYNYHYFIVIIQGGFTAERKVYLSLIETFINHGASSQLVFSVPRHATLFILFHNCPFISIECKSLVTLT